MKPLYTGVVILGSILLSITNAVADCQQDSELLFQCMTEHEGKAVAIRLCDDGRMLQYTLGQPGRQPLLELSVPRGIAATEQWDGKGRYMAYSISFPANGLQYRVFWGKVRRTDENLVEAGVHVEQDFNPLETLHCKEDSIHNNMAGVDLRLAD